MTREIAKTLTLLLLILAVALLAAESFRLHKKCACAEERIGALERALAEQVAHCRDVERLVDAHLNPPPEPTLSDRAKAAYDKAKTAVKSGYESVKETFSGTDGQ